MPKSASVALLCLLASVAGARAQAAADSPANTITQMFAHLNACMASVRITSGDDVTVQFSVNRRGGLIGKPRITHAHWVGDDGERKQSAAAIAQGFDRCLPFSITDALGGAIAGQRIAYRFRGPAQGEQKS